MKNKSKDKKGKNKSGGLKVFLDSGAFSAKSRGQEIKVEDYADFLDEYGHTAHIIASLDSIPRNDGHPMETADITFKNTMYLRERGHNIMPTYHFREDPEVVYRYLDAGFDYIGIGGSARGGLSETRTKWLDKLFDRYLTDGAGRPLANFHGFGVAGKDAGRFPWRSSDSTSAILTAGSRQMFVPSVKSDGSIDYLNPSGRLIFISDKAISVASALFDYDMESVRANHVRKALHDNSTAKGLNYIAEVLENFYQLRLTVPLPEVNVMTMRCICHTYLKRVERQIKNSINPERRFDTAASFLDSSTREGNKVDDYTFYFCLGTPDPHISKVMHVCGIKYRLLSYFDLRVKKRIGKMDNYYGMLKTGLWSDRTLDKFPVQLEFL